MVTWRKRGIGDEIERALRHAKKIEDKETRKAIEELVKAMKSILAELME